MNKKELIVEVANRLKGKPSKADVEKVVNTLIESIKDALKVTDMVKILGFLTLKRKRRPERTLTNPKNGEKIFSPAKDVIRVSVGNPLKMLCKEDIKPVVEEVKTTTKKTKK